MADDKPGFTDSQVILLKEIAKAQKRQERRKTFGLAYGSRWQRTLVTKVLPLAAIIALVFGCDQMRAFLLGQVSG